MEQEPKSRYQKLEKPVFTPAVPEYLLAKLTESEKFLILSVSSIEQQSKWLVENIVEQNKIIRELDERLEKVESFKNTLVSKWSVIAGGALIIVPVFLHESIKAIISHVWGGH